LAQGLSAAKARHRFSHETHLRHDVGAAAAEGQVQLEREALSRPERPVEALGGDPRDFFAGEHGGTPFRRAAVRFSYNPGLKTPAAPLLPRYASGKEIRMANLTRFDPFSDLVDDLFKGFLVRPLGFEGRGETGGAQLPRAKVDVTEKNGAYLVSAELPGVKKEDIHVGIDGAQVTLEAEVKREKEASQDERVLHRERLYGKIVRSFTLPQEVDESKAEAKFRDGVLELTLPKKAAAQRKQISIQ
jgi:HSP20 family protein